MKVAIVGGTGFVGRNVAAALVARGHAVVVIGRSRPEGFVDSPNLRFQAANVGNAESLVSAFDGVDAVVYSAGILRENLGSEQTFESVHLRGVENVVREAVAARADRFVLISANGVAEKGTRYQETKFRAEQVARGCGLEYTILRPSVIFGDSGRSQEFTWQLYRDIVRPRLPAPEFLVRWLPSRQEVVMTPVAIDDVVAAVVRQTEDPLLHKDVFVLGGPEKLGWREMIKRIATAVGRSKIFLPIPIKLMMLPAMLLDRFSFFPVTADQLRMLASGNVAEPDDLRALIGREPIQFSAENLAYLRQETP